MSINVFCFRKTVFGTFFIEGSNRIFHGGFWFTSVVFYPCFVLFFDNLESANKLGSENLEMNFSIEFPNNFKISKNSRNCHFVTNNFYYAIIHFPNIQVPILWDALLVKNRGTSSIFSKNCFSKVIMTIQKLGGTDKDNTRYLMDNIDRQWISKSSQLMV